MKKCFFYATREEVSDQTTYAHNDEEKAIVSSNIEFHLIRLGLAMLVKPVTHTTCPHGLTEKARERLKVGP